MSNWPLVSDFSRMLKTPQVAFRDPELRSCSIELDHLGQPLARSGNFATVFRGYKPDGKEFAIRVFNRKGDERRDRYDVVSKYIEARKSIGLVGFQYDEKGIRSAGDGKFYPLLIMEWVPGVSLFEWARDRCREGYREALQIGAVAWLELVRDLAAQGIVHGDLQHGNVLISHEGQIKLVDYDCMATPELMNRRNMEIGLPPYQHPGRNDQTLVFPGLDNYSALMIYTALRALAADPRLWLTYVDGTGYDKLLFRGEDFQNPHSSALYHELLRSPDDQVRDLTHYLFELRKYDLHSVPDIDEVLLWCERLDVLLGQRDYDKAVKLAERMSPNEPIAPHLAGTLQRARNAIQCRTALEQALERGDEEQAARLYQPELLDDYPAAAKLVEQARAAAQVSHVLKVLDSALQLQSWDMLRNTWQQHEAMLANRPSAKKYKVEIGKLRTVESIRKLLGSTTVDDKRVVAAWQHLQSLGGHPTAEPLRETMKKIFARQSGQDQVQKLLARAPASPTSDFDKEVLQSYKPELLEGSEQAGLMQAYYQSAKQRLSKLKRTKELFQTCTLDGEKELEAIGRELPAAYHPKLGPRVKIAEKRVQSYERLQRLLEEARSDLEIVEHWRALEKAGGTELIPEEDRWRVLLATERAPLLKALQMIDLKVAPLEVDRRLLKIWNEDLLTTCREARKFVPLYEKAKHRQKVLERLEQAIADADVGMIDRLLAEPSLADVAIGEELTASIAGARERNAQARLQRRNALVSSLVDNRRSTFAELFDTDLIREIGRQTKHHQPLIGQWVETEILPRDRSGLTLGPEEGLKRVDETTYRASWTWPASRITNQCRLVVCRERPGPHQLPDDIAGLHAATIDRDAWETGEKAHEFKIEPDWEGALVLVWAFVDIEFQTFYTEPLEIGDLPKKKRGWRLFGG